jgi:hypothetical protein
MPNYNPYFSNVVRPSSGGLRTGGLAHKIIGGIADEHRAQRSYEYAAKLIQDRTVGDIVSHAAKSAITREHLKGTYADELEHGKNVTAAAQNPETFDPNILLRIGNTHLQARGQGFRPPKKKEATSEPTSEPTSEATSDPTFEPPSDLTSEATSEPTREPTSEPTSEPSEDTQSTKRPTMTSLKRKEAAHLKQLADAKAAGPTADKGPDQPVKPTRRRKKSAAATTADTSTSTALSSKSIAEDISKNNGDE